MSEYRVKLGKRPPGRPRLHPILKASYACESFRPKQAGSLLEAAQAFARTWANREYGEESSFVRDFRIIGYSTDQRSIVVECAIGRHRHHRRNQPEDNIGRTITFTVRQIHP